MTCVCTDCLGFDPLNPAEEDRAAERDRRAEPEPTVCFHGATTLPCADCSR